MRDLNCQFFRASLTSKFFYVIVCLVTSDQLFGQENEKRIDSSVVQQLDNALLKQTSQVRKLEMKQDQMARQLNINAQSIQSMRSEIRESLRVQVYENRRSLTDGNILVSITNRVTSVPTPQSNMFALSEQLQLKNQQGRMRLMVGSFKQLNRTLVQESLELERLRLLRNMVQTGENVTPDMLRRPYSISDSEAEELSDKSDSMEDRTALTKNVKSKYLFGQPDVQDYVGPKSKAVYILKSQDLAESMMRSPSSYSLSKLNQLIKENQAARIDEGHAGKVIEVSDTMLRVEIVEKGSDYLGFRGWIDKKRLVRVSNDQD